MTNTAVIGTHVQFTYWLRNHGGDLIAALDDLTLKLVEFKPEHQSIRDTHYLADDDSTVVLSRLHTALKQRFSLLNDDTGRFTFWIRNCR